MIISTHCICKEDRYIEAPAYTIRIVEVDGRLLMIEINTGGRSGPNDRLTCRFMQLGCLWAATGIICASCYDLYTLYG